MTMETVSGIVDRLQNDFAELYAKVAELEAQILELKKRETTR